MSQIKNGGLDHGAKPFEQQQFGTAGAEGLRLHCSDSGAEVPSGLKGRKSNQIKPG